MHHAITRSAAIASALVLTGTLIACSAPGTTPSTTQAPTASASPALQAFESVCLATAPSFAEAAQAAKRLDIAKLDDMGFSHMGMTPDGNLGVQVKPGKECAVTTPSSRDRTLSRQFARLIMRTTGSAMPTQFPTQAKVGDKMFIFHHDRKGGEAFVMLAKGD